MAGGPPYRPIGYLCFRLSGRILVSPAKSGFICKNKKKKLSSLSVLFVGSPQLLKQLQVSDGFWYVILSVSSARFC
jgi:hypothetical protein